MYLKVLPVKLGHRYLYQKRGRKEKVRYGGIFLILRAQEVKTRYQKFEASLDH